MYKIAILPKDQNAGYSDTETEVRTKKAALIEYHTFIKDAFNGETVIAYKIGGNYDDIAPQVLIKKKTDWRMGDRRKFLKYQFLGKLN